MPTPDESPLSEPPQPKWTYSRRISRREANRAIYFDFEGRMDEAPVLLGVYCGGWMRQYVLDRDLSPFAAMSRRAGQRVFQRSTSKALAEALLDPATREERRLVAFSEHELRVLDRWAGREVAQAVAARFFNARDFAAAWVTRDHPDLRRQDDPRTLGDYADLCGFDWPAEFNLAPAEAIERLRNRASTLSRTGRAPNTTGMELWSRLLGYNQLDCRATRHIVLHAIRDARQVRRERRVRLGATAVMERPSGTDGRTLTS